MKSAYAIHGGVTEQDMSGVLAMRGRTQFDITVRHEEIDATHFGDRYLSLVKAHRDRFDAFLSHSDSTKTWDQRDVSSFIHSSGEARRYICDYCLPLLEQLAPQMSFQGLTLEDLLRSPVYTLEIVKTGFPGDTQIIGGNKCSYTPALNLLPLEIVELPPECNAIPRFAGSEFSMDDHDPSSGTLQGRRLVSEGRYMYFKPREAAREKQFDRELCTLNDIKRKRLAKGEIKLPDLHGIVVSGDAEGKCIGVLINMIPASSFGTDLLSPGCWTHGELHEKWEQQVTATVEVLHAHGIVWGDVNPGNVVIDEALNAWVIDFGGMNNPEFVDDDKTETIEGDWQGVRRLFQEWLASRRAGNPL